MGTSRCRPITSAMSRIGTLSFAVACSVDHAASLATEAGIAVFRIAFERWINETASETCHSSFESRSMNSRM
jgi:hypothetical protein